MHHFSYHAGVLHAEDVSLEAVAEHVGTPVYVYAAATLRRHYQVLADAFVGMRCLIAYSVKANSNLAVIATLARMGAGADVVSEGELRRALKAGVPASKIVFSGVGKTARELSLGLDAGISLFNVESEAELAALDAIARDKGVRAPAALRVNPDVAAGGHDKISTGRAEDKFGVAWADAARLYAQAGAMAGVAMQGLDVHIGSQITEATPFETAARRVADLTWALRAEGHGVDRIDMGGGLGIAYEGAGPGAALPRHYAEVLRQVLEPLEVEVILEPGRVIAANAGVLLSRVVYTKHSSGRDFVILDAAMNDLLRPALYGAWHDIRPVRAPAPDHVALPVDVVGPVCETGDTFARDRRIAPLQAGDLVAIMSAGAYGASQASEYNSRPRVAEVLVDAGHWHLARRRPTFDEMTALESFPTPVVDTTAAPSE